MAFIEAPIQPRSLGHPTLDLVLSFTSSHQGQVGMVLIPHLAQRFFIENQNDIAQAPSGICSLVRTILTWAFVRRGNGKSNRRGRVAVRRSLQVATTDAMHLVSLASWTSPTGDQGHIAHQHDILDSLHSDRRLYPSSILLGQSQNASQPVARSQSQWRSAQVP